MQRRRSTEKIVNGLKRGFEPSEITTLPDSFSDYSRHPIIFSTFAYNLYVSLKSTRNSMKSEDLSRRSFLKRALALSAASAIPSFWIPAKGMTPRVSANDKVNIAFIGIGQ